MQHKHQYHPGIMHTSKSAIALKLAKETSLLTAFLLSSADTALWDRCRNISITLDTAPLPLLLSEPARGRPCVWQLEDSTWLWWDDESEDDLLDGDDDILRECCKDNIPILQDANVFSRFTAEGKNMTYNKLCLVCHLAKQRLSQVWITWKESTKRDSD
jgi:hypothetical protein